MEKNRKKGKTVELKDEAGYNTNSLYFIRFSLQICISKLKTKMFTEIP